MDIDKLIEKAVKEVVNKAVKEVAISNAVNDNHSTVYQRTETLLYKYTTFQDAINNTLEEIEYIKKEGTFKKSKSITHWSSNLLFDRSTEFDKAQEEIEKRERSIDNLKDYINRIDIALEHIENDPYYEVIRLKYFEGKTMDHIAEHFEVDVSTISRNKNRLINTLQISLFASDYIAEMGILV